MKDHRILRILKSFLCCLLILLACSCKNEEAKTVEGKAKDLSPAVHFAQGFQIFKGKDGVSLIEVSSPWPNAQKKFSYALVPKPVFPEFSSKKADYDAVIPVPVDKIVVTSTTHIPALEALGVSEKLVGFPGTPLVSSVQTRKRIGQGKVTELGSNEAINTEILLDIAPDVLIGFGINGKNKAYETFKNAGIPVVYNGDWTEETPLGKAEWIKFFAPFFGLEEKADSLFSEIRISYQQTKNLAETAVEKPTVLSGGLYKDVWHVAGGKSWVAQFLDDANTAYFWSDTKNTGSISLSIESVLEKAQQADFWINPSTHTSYRELSEANRHYSQFKAFKEKKIYTHAGTRGETGGLLFYEYAPNRPDIVLKDLIHIFHPGLLPDYKPFFFKPLE